MVLHTLMTYQPHALPYDPPCALSMSLISAHAACVRHAVCLDMHARRLQGLWRVRHAAGHDTHRLQPLVAGSMHLTGMVHAAMPDPPDAPATSRVGPVDGLLTGGVSAFFPEKRE